MKTKNLVVLLGYVSGSVIEREFENNSKLVQFVLKTRDIYLKDGERKVEKNFHNIALWNSVTYKATELLQDGDIVMITGRLKYRKITTQSGEIIFKTEIVAEEWTKIQESYEHEFEDSISK